MKIKVIGDNYLHKLYVFDISFNILKHLNKFKMYLWVEGLEINPTEEKSVDIMDIYDYEAYRGFLFGKLSFFMKEIKEKYENKQGD